MTSGCPFHAKKNAATAAPAIEEIPLGTRLKQQTQAAHDRTENHPSNAAVLSGTAGIEPYAHHLGQLGVIHSALEPALANFQYRGHALGALLQPYHFRLPALFDDLAFLEAPASVLRPTQSAAAIRDMAINFASRQSPAILGIFYVFEGSTNGGTIIAKRLRTAFNWADERGTQFINPHGAAVRQRWMEWKSSLDALRFSASEQQEIIDAACATFDHLSTMFNEIPLNTTATR